ncbi:MAG: phosphatidate cytidylyltransferase [Deltaproteobacteria bacterium]|nr:phosphatidate cytidylyltransferase [Deltaproteobacteria bacterium]MCL5278183.1 phosphatidate cytidylyltransferase [Deltaproteobacteria bacterium]
MKSGELSKRLLTALVGVPIIVFAFIKGGYVLLAVVLFVALVGLWEFFNIMEARGYRPLRISGYVSGILIILSVYLLNGSYLLVLFGTVLFILIAGLFEEDNRTALSGTGGTVFGVMYIAGLLGFGIKLRDLGTVLERHYKPFVPLFSAHHIDDYTGVYAIFFVVAVIFLNDTGAYFIGRAYGRRRVAPAISPKKSWEGVLGGVAASVATACVIWRISPERFPLAHAIILSVILSFSGLAGDLAESRMKRDAGVKDSGAIFPGHGGIMDRIDALLFGLPVAYVYFLFYFRFIFSR